MAEEKKAKAHEEGAKAGKKEEKGIAKKEEKTLEKHARAAKKEEAKKREHAEKKPGKGKKAAEEKKIERQFVISLRKVYLAPMPKRANRAITAIERFMFKHFRAKPENVFISPALNELIWSRGREHVPRKVAVKAIESAGKVSVYLPGEKAVEKKPEKEKPKAEEKKSKEEIEAEKKREEELERKREEKRELEKAGEAAAIKRGTQ